MHDWVGYNENVLNGSGCREGYGGSKWESAAMVFQICMRCGGSALPCEHSPLSGVGAVVSHKNFSHS